MKERTVTRAMATKVKVTSKIYDCVKLLFENGATYKEAADFFHLSLATVNTIKASDSFEEYKHMAMMRGSKWKAANKKKQVETAKPEVKPEAKPETVLTDDKQKGGTISANYQVSRIYELLKQQNETLTMISNKLAFIVDELTK